MSDWIDVNEKLPLCSNVVKAKTSDGDEIKCYFHKDRMGWLSNYTKANLTHFQCHKSLKFLDNVTHWK